MRRPIVTALFVCALLGGALLARAPAQEARRPAQVDDFAWIAGHWVSDIGGGMVAESVWAAPRGGTMMGMYRQTREGATTLYELAVIEPGPEGPVLRIRHFHPGLVPWASEADGPLVCPLGEVGEAGARRVAFTGPAGSGLSSIVFERVEDGLHVTVGLAGEGESPWLIRFRPAE